MITALFLVGVGLLLSALGLLALAGVYRATRPAPGLHRQLRAEATPEAVAARACRELAVASTARGSRPQQWVPEAAALVQRVTVRTALGPQDTWVVVVRGIVTGTYDDLAALEVALVGHVRRRAALASQAGVA